ncbi:NACHT domain-containing protein [Gemmatimonadota bacterium]
MNSPLNISIVIEKYNSACDAYREAAQLQSPSQLAKAIERYCTTIRNAFNALESGWRLYLNQFPELKGNAKDANRLKKLYVDDAKYLLAKYADPPFTEDMQQSIEEAQEARKYVEHHNLTPGPEAAIHCIKVVHSFLQIYMELPCSSLFDPDELESATQPTDDRLAEYYASIRHRYGFISAVPTTFESGLLSTQVSLQQIFIQQSAIVRHETPSDPQLLPESDKVTKSSAQPSESGAPFPFPDKKSVGPTILDTLQDILHDSRTHIVGSAGAGKSTLLAKIALSIASDDSWLSDPIRFRIPVIIHSNRLYEWLTHNPSSSLLAYLTDSYSDKYGDLINRSIHNNNAIIMLDGLDELPHHQAIGTVLNSLDHLLSDYYSNHAIICSRPLRNIPHISLESYRSLELCGFTYQQIQQYAEQWTHQLISKSPVPITHKVHSGMADELWGLISADYALLELARNPLVLSMILAMHAAGYDTPSNLGSIVGSYLDLLLFTRPRQQHRPHISNDIIEPVLEQAAYYLLSNPSGSTSLTAQEIMGIIDGVLESSSIPSGEQNIPDNEAVLDHICTQCNVLLNTYTSPAHAEYVFFHATACQYFAACYTIKALLSGNLSLHSIIHTPIWHITTDYFGYCLSKMGSTATEQFINDILNISSPYEHHLHRDLCSAGSMLANISTECPNVYPLVFSRLIDTALEPINHTLERAILSILLRLPTPSESLFDTRLIIDRDDSNETKAKKVDLALATGMYVMEAFAVLLDLYVDLIQFGEDEPNISWFLGEAPFNIEHHMAYSSPLTCDISTASSLLTITTPKRTYEYYFKPTVSNRIIRHAPFTLKQEMITQEHGQSTLTLGVVPFTESTRDIKVLDKIMLLEMISDLKANHWELSGYLLSKDIQEQLSPLLNELVKIAESHEDWQSRLSALFQLTTIINNTAATPLDSINSDLLDHTWAESFSTILNREEHPDTHAIALRLLRQVSKTPLQWIGKVGEALEYSHAALLSEAILCATLYPAPLPKPIASRIWNLLDHDDPNICRDALQAIIWTKSFQDSDILNLVKRSLATQPPKRSGTICWNIYPILLLGENATSSQSIDVLKRALSLFLKDLADNCTPGFWGGDFAWMGYQDSIPLHNEIGDYLLAFYSNQSAVIRRCAVGIYCYTRPKDHQIDLLLPLLIDSDTDIVTNVLQAVEPKDYSNQQLRTALYNFIVNIDTNADLAHKAADLVSQFSDTSHQAEASETLNQILNNNSSNSAAFSALWALQVDQADR